MKIKDLDGKIYNWNLTNIPNKKSRSDLQNRAKLLLHTIYPSYRIIEDVHVPGIGLYLDFFIPQAKLVVEVHGEQHYKYTLHFFKDKMKYYQAKNRDRIKIDWCELNGFNFIELSYKESEDEWKTKLLTNN